MVYLDILKAAFTFGKYDTSQEVAARGCLLNGATERWCADVSDN